MGRGMSVIKVWFNHWFSTAYHIARLMKEGRENIWIIGSNRVEYAVMRNICDEWYQEPDLSGEEYTEYCLEFCRRHEVDVFVPRRQMVEISRKKALFAEIGTKVLVDDYELIAVLNDKSEAYARLQGIPDVSIPQFRVADSREQLEQALNDMKECWERLCIKYVNDEGALSFRVIDDHRKKSRSLNSYAGNRISSEELRQILDEEEPPFRPIMVMPYLPGNEISVDCLSTESGLIAVPRIKGNSRDEIVRFDEDVIEKCRKILERFPLKTPCNIQFKLMDGVPYLLEINTRMSGGIYMTCLAAGINIPSIALNQLLGQPVTWSLDRREKRVSYIETAVVLKE